MTTDTTTPAESPASAPVTAPKSTKAPVKKQLGKPKALATKKTVAAPKAKPVAKPVTTPTTPKDTKAKKTKMVRDSFTFPKDEYAVLDALKLRAAKLGNPVKKTELLRAGVKAIAALTDTALLTVLAAVPTIKTGRPTKNKAD